MHFPEKSHLLELLTNRCNSLRIFKQIQTQFLTRNDDDDEDDLIINKFVTFLGKSSDFGSYSCKILRHRRRSLNSFPYNTLLSSYAISDKPKVTILVYREFIRNGFSPDTYTFPPVFKACGRFSGIGEGKQIHGIVTKLGFLDDLYVANSVLNHLYGVCGELENACKVFDEMPVRDVVSWSGVITGFAKVGLYKEALDMFLKMDVEANLATYVCALVASGRIRCLSLGKGIHGLLLKKSSLVSLEIGNALIDMYSKCEELRDAMRVFDELREKKDTVSWNSMISGLVRCNKAKEAIGLFTRMQASSGLKPDGHILTSVLSACASLGDVDYGKWVHEYIVTRKIKWDTHIGTAIVDMYSKCGYIETALEVFDEIKSKNVFTWNALLTGLAIHGHGHKSLEIFEEMVKLGFKPNEVTFLAVLNACCHSGLVDEGRRYFHKMKTEHMITPKIEHYGCLIDLLCRFGSLDEAIEIVKSMPVKPDVIITGAILSAACKSNENIPKEILDTVLEIEFEEEEDSGVYVLLSNIFADNKRWDDVEKIRKLMKVKGILKVPGASAIDV